MRKYQKETTVNNTEFITEITSKAKSPLLATLAIRLVKCIDESGITQAEVCQNTGIFPSNLSDYIHGKIEPKISQIDKLARLFNVSTDYLLGRAKCSTPENEEINKKTGLSEKAILKLIEMNSNDVLSFGDHELRAVNALLSSGSDILFLLSQYLFSSYERGFSVLGVYDKEYKQPLSKPLENVVGLIIEAPISSGSTMASEVDPNIFRYAWLKQIEERLSDMMQKYKKAMEDNTDGKRNETGE